LQVTVKNVTALLSVFWLSFPRKRESSGVVFERSMSKSQDQRQSRWITRSSRVMTFVMGCPVKPWDVIRSGQWRSSMPGCPVDTQIKSVHDDLLATTAKGNFKIQLW